MLFQHTAVPSLSLPSPDTSQPTPTIASAMGADEFGEQAKPATLEKQLRSLARFPARKYNE